MCVYRFILVSDKSMTQSSLLCSILSIDGKTISLGGTRPKIYAFANYDSLEAKFEKKTNTLNLKFRSRLAGTGKNDGDDKPVFLYDKNGKQIMGNMDSFLSRYREWN